jgi:hypothetical protein
MIRKLLCCVSLGVTLLAGQCQVACKSPGFNFHQHFVLQELSLTHGRRIFVFNLCRLIGRFVGFENCFSGHSTQ